jgi:aminopeptidase N
MTQPQAIYRKDYTVSPYLIHTTELSFRLDEHETIVSSKIDFYQNTLSADKSGNLFLNGIDLELISILVHRILIKRRFNMCGEYT